jgi:hypothetical protein
MSGFGRENAVSDIHPNKIRERCWARDVKAHPLELISSHPRSAVRHAPFDFLVPIAGFVC